MGSHHRVTYLKRNLLSISITWIFAVEYKGAAEHLVYAICKLVGVSRVSLSA